MRCQGGGCGQTTVSATEGALGVRGEGAARNARKWARSSPGVWQVVAEQLRSAGTGVGLDGGRDRSMTLPGNLPRREGGRVPETWLQVIHKAQLLNCKRDSVNPGAKKGMRKAS